jgi:hypothetical protein
MAADAGRGLDMADFDLLFFIVIGNIIGLANRRTCLTPFVNFIVIRNDYGIACNHKIFFRAAGDYFPVL